MGPRFHKCGQMGPKCGMNFEGRRPMGPRFHKCGQMGPKCGMNFEGRRPMGPRFHKCGKFNRHNFGAHQGWQRPSFGNKCRKNCGCGM